MAFKGEAIVKKRNVLHLKVELNAMEFKIHDDNKVKRRISRRMFNVSSRGRSYWNDSIEMGGGSDGCGDFYDKTAHKERFAIFVISQIEFNLHTSRSK
ncbi:CLUMA_CG019847, isoform A [Clunio marinus]|uniref:CLUMA_CG019847, isoform A n=1 Tax=Clunio marinus TaxID=568069 RepID=A0A1J1J2W5_9DIPT|nr:CLUMA_CG019847, isoform A [Clunio marinus]